MKMTMFMMCVISSASAIPAACICGISIQAMRLPAMIVATYAFTLKPH